MSFPNTDFPSVTTDTWLENTWHYCNNAELRFNAGVRADKDTIKDRFLLRYSAGALMLGCTSDGGNWHEMVSFNEDNAVFWHSPQNITTVLRFLHGMSYMAFNTSTDTEKYMVHALEDDKWKVKVGGVGDAISVDDAGEVTLSHAGNKKLVTSKAGVDLYNHSSEYVSLWFKPEQNKWMNFGWNGTIGTIAQRARDTEVYENTFIQFERDGAVKLYFNGYQTTATSPWGLEILKNPNVNATGVHLKVNGQQTVLIRRDTGDSYLDSTSSSDQYGRRLNFNYDGSNALVGTWTGSVTPSDSRLKRNLTPVNGLNKLLQLEPMHWDWESPEHNTYSNEGFTAESYAKVFPDLVEDIPVDKLPSDLPADPANPIKGIKKDITGLAMDAYLVDAIKSLKAENDALKKRIEALEGKASTTGGAH